MAQPGSCQGLWDRPSGDSQDLPGVVASLWSKQLVITHMPSLALSWPPTG